MKNAKGFIGVTRYVVIDNPDNLMGKPGVPFKAITVRELGYS
jgi:hypothetical protein